MRLGRLETGGFAGYLWALQVAGAKSDILLRPQTLTPHSAAPANSLSQVVANSPPIRRGQSAQPTSGARRLTR